MLKYIFWKCKHLLDKHAICEQYTNILKSAWNKVITLCETVCTIILIKKMAIFK